MSDNNEGKVNIEEAEMAKTTGNEYFKKKNFPRAIQEYTRAIELNPNVAAYYSNRAFCHLKLENFGSAVSDATKSIEVDPKYVKGYYRRGSAHFALGKYQEARTDFKLVLSILPNERDAKRRMLECKKAIRAKAFAEAIESEKPIPPSETMTYTDIKVEASYDGPHLQDDTVTLEFVKELAQAFKEQKKLHRRYAISILMKIITLFKQLPSLVDVPVPKGTHINVCGDVHGQFYDVLNIFDMAGFPSEDNPFLFNGDFVDRGSFSLEVILLFFSLKLLYPNHFHMTRGNHESFTMNQIYGFRGEVKAKLSEQVFELFTEAFNWLPLGYVLNNKVLVVHGGLFSQDGVKLSQLRDIERNRQPPESGLMCEIMWSDPQQMPGRAPSKRGVSMAFGPDVTKRFLDDNNLELLVRSHEVKSEGYAVDHDGKCITIFSAPNYCDQMGNKGAYIRFESDMKPKFTSFVAVPHPDVKPMAYASPMFGF